MSDTPSTPTPAQLATGMASTAALSAAVQHAVNRLGWDARMNTPDYQLSDTLVPEIVRSVLAQVEQDCVLRVIGNPQVRDQLTLMAQNRANTGGAPDGVHAVLDDLAELMKLWA